ncbi:hypothetical protein [Streptomyces sp. NPDC048002]|uniref:hypothetical protein n=1 Tax=Streptomyces sp. NPDC048002 TaxID=3154344 RepID=UPI0033C5CA24
MSSTEGEPSGCGLTGLPHYLERACRIQVTAQSTGTPLTLPPAEVCEPTARQLNGEEHGSDLQGDQAYDLAWQAMLSLVQRDRPRLR